MRWLALSFLAVAACHADQPLSDLYFAWDDRRVLCSEPIDDLTGVERNWTADESRFRKAHDSDWVTLVHAHIPGKTVSTDAIDRVFDWAETYKLDYVTFAELTPDHPPTAGLAFAFDDNSVDEWFGLRDRFLARHARLTFFVTRWAQLSPQQLDEIAQLARDGHDIEPHSVDHPNALDYVQAHGIDAYITDEVLPSIQIMIAAGYHPTSYAYPFGVHDEAIDDAVLEHIDRVRTTPGECPSPSGVYPTIPGE